MATDTLKLLEFPELLSLLGSYISSPLGRARLDSVLPCTHPDTITARQQLASEASEYIRQRGKAADEELDRSPASATSAPAPTLPLSFSGFSDPGPALDKAAVEGTVLEGPEISQ